MAALRSRFQILGRISRQQAEETGVLLISSRRHKIQDTSHHIKSEPPQNSSEKKSTLPLDKSTNEDDLTVNQNSADTKRAVQKAESPVAPFTEPIPEANRETEHPPVPSLFVQKNLSPQRPAYILTGSIQPDLLLEMPRTNDFISMSSDGQFMHKRFYSASGRKGDSTQTCEEFCVESGPQLPEEEKQTLEKCTIRCKKKPRKQYGLKREKFKYGVTRPMRKLGVRLPGQCPEDINPCCPPKPSPCESGKPAAFKIVPKPSACQIPQPGFFCGNKATEPEDVCESSLRPHKGPCDPPMPPTHPISSSQKFKMIPHDKNTGCPQNNARSTRTGGQSRRACGQAKTRTSVNKGKCYRCTPKINEVQRERGPCDPPPKPPDVPPLVSEPSPAPCQETCPPVKNLKVLPVCNEVNFKDEANTKYCKVRKPPEIPSCQPVKHGSCYESTAQLQTVDTDNCIPEAMLPQNSITEKIVSKVKKEKMRTEWVQSKDKRNQHRTSRKRKVSAPISTCKDPCEKVCTDPVGKTGEDNTSCVETDCKKKEYQTICEELGVNVRKKVPPTYDREQKCGGCGDLRDGKDRRRIFNARVPMIFHHRNYRRDFHELCQECNVVKERSDVKLKQSTHESERITSSRISRNRTKPKTCKNDSKAQGSEKADKHCTGFYATRSQRQPVKRIFTTRKDVSRVKNSAKEAQSELTIADLRKILNYEKLPPNIKKLLTNEAAMVLNVLCGNHCNDTQAISHRGTSVKCSKAYTNAVYDALKSYKVENPVNLFSNTRNKWTRGTVPSIEYNSKSGRRPMHTVSVPLKEQVCNGFSEKKYDLETTVTTEKPVGSDIPDGYRIVDNSLDTFAESRPQNFEVKRIDAEEVQIRTKNNAVSGMQESPQEPFENNLNVTEEKLEVEVLHHKNITECRNHLLKRKSFRKCNELSSLKHSSHAVTNCKKKYTTYSSTLRGGNLKQLITPFSLKSTGRATTSIGMLDTREFHNKVATSLHESSNISNDAQRISRNITRVGSPTIRTMTSFEKREISQSLFEPVKIRNVLTVTRGQEISSYSFQNQLAHGKRMAHSFLKKLKYDSLINSVNKNNSTCDKIREVDTEVEVSTTKSEVETEHESSYLQEDPLSKAEFQEMRDNSAGKEMKFKNKTGISKSIYYATRKTGRKCRTYYPLYKPMIVKEKTKTSRIMEKYVKSFISSDRRLVILKTNPAVKRERFSSSDRGTYSTRYPSFYQIDPAFPPNSRQIHLHNHTQIWVNDVKTSEEYFPNKINQTIQEDNCNTTLESISAAEKTKYGYTNEHNDYEYCIGCKSNTTHTSPFNFQTSTQIKQHSNKDGVLKNNTAATKVTTKHKCIENRKITKLFPICKWKLHEHSMFVVNTFHAKPAYADEVELRRRKSKASEKKIRFVGDSNKTVRFLDPCTRMKSLSDYKISDSKRDINKLLNKSLTYLSKGQQSLPEVDQIENELRNRERVSTLTHSINVAEGIKDRHINAQLQKNIAYTSNLLDAETNKGEYRQMSSNVEDNSEKCYGNLEDVIEDKCCEPEKNMLRSNEQGIRSDEQVGKITSQVNDVSEQGYLLCSKSDLREYTLELPQDNEENTTSLSKNTNISRTSNILNHEISVNHGEQKSAHKLQQKQVSAFEEKQLEQYNMQEEMDNNNENYTGIRKCNSASNIDQRELYTLKETQEAMHSIKEESLFSTSTLTNKICPTEKLDVEFHHKIPKITRQFAILVKKDKSKKTEHGIERPKPEIVGKKHQEINSVSYTNQIPITPQSQNNCSTFYPDERSLPKMSPLRKFNIKPCKLDHVSAQSELAVKHNPHIHLAKDYHAIPSHVSRKRMSKIVGKAESPILQRDSLCIKRENNLRSRNTRITSPDEKVSMQKQKNLMATVRTEEAIGKKEEQDLPYKNHNIGSFTNEKDNGSVSQHDAEHSILKSSMHTVDTVEREDMSKAESQLTIHTKKSQVNEQSRCLDAILDVPCYKHLLERRTQRQMPTTSSVWKKSFNHKTENQEDTLKNNLTMSRKNADPQLLKEVESSITRTARNVKTRHSNSVDSKYNFISRNVVMNCKSDRKDDLERRRLSELGRKSVNSKSSPCRSYNSKCHYSVSSANESENLRSEKNKLLRDEEDRDIRNENTSEDNYTISGVAFERKDVDHTNIEHTEECHCTNAIQSNQNPKLDSITNIKQAENGDQSRKEASSKNVRKSARVTRSRTDAGNEENHLVDQNHDHDVISEVTSLFSANVNEQEQGINTNSETKYKMVSSHSTTQTKLKDNYKQEMNINDSSPDNDSILQLTASNAPQGKVREPKRRLKQHIVERELPSYTPCGCTSSTPAQYECAQQNEIENQVYTDKEEELPMDGIVKSEEYATLNKHTSQTDHSLEAGNPPFISMSIRKGGRIKSIYSAEHHNTEDVSTDKVYAMINSKTKQQSSSKVKFREMTKKQHEELGVLQGQETYVQNKLPSGEKAISSTSPKIILNLSQKYEDTGFTDGNYSQRNEIQQSLISAKDSIEESNEGHDTVVQIDSDISKTPETTKHNNVSEITLAKDVATSSLFKMQHSNSKSSSDVISTKQKAEEQCLEGERNAKDGTSLNSGTTENYVINRNDSLIETNNLPHKSSVITLSNTAKIEVGSVSQCTEETDSNIISCDSPDVVSNELGPRSTADVSSDETKMKLEHVTNSVRFQFSNAINATDIERNSRSQSEKTYNQSTMEERTRIVEEDEATEGQTEESYQNISEVNGETAGQSTLSRSSEANYGVSEETSSSKFTETTRFNRLRTLVKSRDEDGKSELLVFLGNEQHSVKAPFEDKASSRSEIKQDVPRTYLIPRKKFRRCKKQAIIYGGEIFKKYTVISRPPFGKCKKDYESAKRVRLLNTNPAYKYSIPANNFGRDNYKSASYIKKRSTNDGKAKEEINSAQNTAAEYNTTEVESAYEDGKELPEHKTGAEKKYFLNQDEDDSFSRKVLEKNEKKPFLQNNATENLVGAGDLYKSNISVHQQRKVSKKIEKSGDYEGIQEKTVKKREDKTSLERSTTRKGNTGKFDNQTENLQAWNEIKSSRIKEEDVVSNKVSGSKAKHLEHDLTEYDMEDVNDNLVEDYAEEGPKDNKNKSSRTPTTKREVFPGYKETSNKPIQGYKLVSLSRSDNYPVIRKMPQRKTLVERIHMRKQKQSEVKMIEPRRKRGRTQSALSSHFPLRQETPHKVSSPDRRSVKPRLDERKSFSPKRKLPSLDESNTTQEDASEQTKLQSEEREVLNGKAPTPDLADYFRSKLNKIVPSFLRKGHRTEGQSIDRDHYESEVREQMLLNYNEDLKSKEMPRGQAENVSSKSNYYSSGNYDHKKGDEKNQKQSYKNMLQERNTSQALAATSYEDNSSVLQKIYKKDKIPLAVDETIQVAEKTGLGKMDENLALKEISTKSTSQPPVQNTNQLEMPVGFPEITPNSASDGVRRCKKVGTILHEEYERRNALKASSENSTNLTSTKELLLPQGPQNSDTIRRKMFRYFSGKGTKVSGQEQRISNERSGGDAARKVVKVVYHEKPRLLRRIARTPERKNTRSISSLQSPANSFTCIRNRKDVSVSYVSSYLGKRNLTSAQALKKESQGYSSPSLCLNIRTYSPSVHVSSKKVTRYGEVNGVAKRTKQKSTTNEIGKMHRSRLFSKKQQIHSKITYTGDKKFEHAVKRKQTSQLSSQNVIRPLIINKNGIVWASPLRRRHKAKRSSFSARLAYTLHRLEQLKVVSPTKKQPHHCACFHSPWGKFTAARKMAENKNPVMSVTRHFKSHSQYKQRNFASKFESSKHRAKDSQQNIWEPIKIPLSTEGSPRKPLCIPLSLRTKFYTMPPTEELKSKKWHEQSLSHGTETSHFRKRTWYKKKYVPNNALPSQRLHSMCALNEDHNCIASLLSTESFSPNFKQLLESGPPNQTASDFMACHSGLTKSAMSERHNFFAKSAFQKNDNENACSQASIANKLINGREDIRVESDPSKKVPFLYLKQSGVLDTETRNLSSSAQGEPKTFVVNEISMEKQEAVNTNIISVKPQTPTTPNRSNVNQLNLTRSFHVLHRTQSLFSLLQTDQKVKMFSHRARRHHNSDSQLVRKKNRECKGNNTQVDCNILEKKREEVKKETNKCQATRSQYIHRSSVFDPDEDEVEIIFDAKREKGLSNDENKSKERHRKRNSNPNIKTPLILHRVINEKHGSETVISDKKIVARQYSESGHEKEDNAPSATYNSEDAQTRVSLTKINNASEQQKKLETDVKRKENVGIGRKYIKKRNYNKSKEQEESLTRESHDEFVGENIQIVKESANSRTSFVDKEKEDGYLPRSASARKFKSTSGKSRREDGENSNFATRNVEKMLSNSMTKIQQKHVQFANVEHSEHTKNQLKELKSFKRPTTVITTQRVEKPTVNKVNIENSKDGNMESQLFVRRSKVDDRGIGTSLLAHKKEGFTEDLDNLNEESHQTLQYRSDIKPALGTASLNNTIDKLHQPMIKNETQPQTKIKSRIVETRKISSLNSRQKVDSSRLGKHSRDFESSISKEAMKLESKVEFNTILPNEMSSSKKRDLFEAKHRKDFTTRRTQTVTQFNRELRHRVTPSCRNFTSQLLKSEAIKYKEMQKLMERYNPSTKRTAADNPLWRSKSRERKETLKAIINKYTTPVQPVKNTISEDSLKELLEHKDTSKDVNLIKSETVKNADLQQTRISTVTKVKQDFKVFLTSFLDHNTARLPNFNVNTDTIEDTHNETENKNIVEKQSIQNPLTKPRVAFRERLRNKSEYDQATAKYQLMSPQRRNYNVVHNKKNHLSTVFTSATAEMDGKDKSATDMVIQGSGSETVNKQAYLPLSTSKSDLQNTIEGTVFVETQKPLLARLDSNIPMHSNSRKRLSSKISRSGREIVSSKVKQNALPSKDQKSIEREKYSGGKSASPTFWPRAKRAGDFWWKIVKSIMLQMNTNGAKTSRATLYSSHVPSSNKTAASGASNVHLDSRLVHTSNVDSRNPNRLPFKSRRKGKRSSKNEIRANNGVNTEAQVNKRKSPRAGGKRRDKTSLPEEDPKISKIPKKSQAIPGIETQAHDNKEVFESNKYVKNNSTPSNSKGELKVPGISQTIDSSAAKESEHIKPRNSDKVNVHKENNLTNKEPRTCLIMKGPSVKQTDVKPQPSENDVVYSQKKNSLVQLKKAPSLSNLEAQFLTIAQEPILLTIKEPTMNQTRTQIYPSRKDELPFDRADSISKYREAPSFLKLAKFQPRKLIYPPGYWRSKSLDPVSGNCLPAQTNDIQVLEKDALLSDARMSRPSQVKTEDDIPSAIFLEAVRVSLKKNRSRHQIILDSKEPGSKNKLFTSEGNNRPHKISRSKVNKTGAESKSPSSPPRKTSKNKIERNKSTDRHSRHKLKVYYNIRTIPRNIRLGSKVKKLYPLHTTVKRKLNRTENVSEKPSSAPSSINQRIPANDKLKQYAAQNKFKYRIVKGKPVVASKARNQVAESLAPKYLTKKEQAAVQSEDVQGASLSRSTRRISLIPDRLKIKHSISSSPGKDLRSSTKPREVTKKEQATVKSEKVEGSSLSRSTRRISLSPDRLKVKHKISPTPGKHSASSTKPKELAKKEEATERSEEVQGASLSRSTRRISLSPDRLKVKHKISSTTGKISASSTRPKELTKKEETTVKYEKVQGVSLSRSTRRISLSPHRLKVIHNISSTPGRDSTPSTKSKELIKTEETTVKFEDVQGASLSRNTRTMSLSPDRLKVKHRISSTLEKHSASATKPEELVKKEQGTEQSEKVEDSSLSRSTKMISLSPDRLNIKHKISSTLEKDSASATRPEELTKKEVEGESMSRSTNRISLSQDRLNDKHKNFSTLEKDSASATKPEELTKKDQGTEQSEEVEGASLSRSTKMISLSPDRLNIKHKISSTLEKDSASATKPEEMTKKEQETEQSEEVEGASLSRSTKMISLSQDRLNVKHKISSTLEKDSASATKPEELTKKKQGTEQSEEVEGASLSRSAKRISLSQDRFNVKHKSSSTRVKYSTSSTKAIPNARINKKSGVAKNINTKELAADAQNISSAQKYKLVIGNSTEDKSNLKRDKVSSKNSHKPRQSKQSTVLKQDSDNVSNYERKVLTKEEVDKLNQELQAMNPESAEKQWVRGGITKKSKANKDRKTNIYVQSQREPDALKSMPLKEYSVSRAKLSKSSTGLASGTPVTREDEKKTVANENKTADLGFRANAYRLLTSTTAIWKYLVSDQSVAAESVQGNQGIVKADVSGKLHRGGPQRLEDDKLGKLVSVKPEPGEFADTIRGILSYEDYGSLPNQPEEDI